MDEASRGVKSYLTNERVLEVVGTPRLSRNATSMTDASSAMASRSTRCIIRKCYQSGESSTLPIGRLLRPSSDSITALLSTSEQQSSKAKMQDYADYLGEQVLNEQRIVCRCMSSIIVMTKLTMIRSIIDS